MNIFSSIKEKRRLAMKKDEVEKRMERKQAELDKMMKRQEGWEVMQRLYIMRCEVFPDHYKTNPIKNLEGEEMPDFSKHLNDIAVARNSVRKEKT